ncbi:polyhydroxyalkanoate depolymerase [Sinirhodobacter ferrireducens]|uniref:Polyhydroxyalkanoate depolymerase n=1 Tax=Paenirhodobacter ferrireducens TaxID=1215032 RepID=A0A443L5N7_9RHOB|nr:polyhydroxyalkanoate depolymerase [Sinirhodobacter ferrireducens]RWR44532.1 polyhydroxyalkanoate depolymerase [Sinirhodobacter ferrireducens]
MLYATYQSLDDIFAPFRTAAHFALSFTPKASGPFAQLIRQQAAGLEMITRFGLSHDRPRFGIGTVKVDGRERPVREEVALELPFGRLLHFARDLDTPLPKVLVTAPLSGHFATLLAGTVRTLLRDHDVYITDWTNARDVPLSAGDFGVEDYVAYLIRFMEEIGPGAHMLAVCQPCVQALAATAVMSEDRNPATPRSLVLMAGPVDVRESPTSVNDLANEKPMDWFERTVIGTVPLRFAGAGRKVYPGFVQLFSFMAMNMDRHREQHEKLYQHLANGEEAEAKKIKEFYDEYFSVLDLTAEFYLETIERVFQKAELATGDFTYKGQKVNPGAIRHTALLTVEGGRDDICGLGQTSAAHDLCSALRPHLKRHHLQANVGHYGVFNGRRWDNEIYPVVRNMILAVD